MGETCRSEGAKINGTSIIKKWLHENGTER